MNSPKLGFLFFSFFAKTHFKKFFSPFTDLAFSRARKNNPPITYSLITEKILKFAKDNAIFAVLVAFIGIKWNLIELPRLPTYFSGVNFD